MVAAPSAVPKPHVCTAATHAEGSGANMNDRTTSPINTLLTHFIALLVIALFSSHIQAAEKITFNHYDLLGSPIAATDERGNVIWREEYSPYGSKILNQDASSDNTRGYTGHVHDSETGLIYMQARYYDPTIGRFMSIDPVEFKSDNPLSFNRYAYANNNPYIFTDPNGEYAELGIEALSISIGISSLVQNIDEGRYLDAFIDGLGILGDVAAGAIPAVPGVLGLSIDASRNGARLNKSEQAVDAIAESSALKKPLLGHNPKIKKSRTLTDLDPVHDRATAKSIFRNLSKGQHVRQFKNKKGDIIRRADDGTQIRMNPDGSTRLDLPGRGTQPNGETIHFNP